MASIRNIIRRGRGTAGAWRVFTSADGIGELWHYSTRLATWKVLPDGSAELVDYSTGWGSVSDQGGLNTLFRSLAMPYRFDRDQRGGGARITHLDGAPYRPGPFTTGWSHLR